MLATKNLSVTTSSAKTSSTVPAVSLAKPEPVKKTAQNATAKTSASKTTQTQVLKQSGASDVHKVEELKKAVTKEIPTKTAQAITENTIEKGPKPLVKSAGAIIRECFIAALNSGLIDDKAMAILTSAEKTSEVLKIRYAFLLEVKTGSKEERMVKGNARYTAKPIVEYKSKKYYITNDLYARNVSQFKDWINTLESVKTTTVKKSSRVSEKKKK